MRISDWSSDVCSSDLGASDDQSVLAVVCPAAPLVGGRGRADAGIFCGRPAPVPLSPPVRGADIVPPPLAEGLGTGGVLRARLSSDRAVLAGLDLLDRDADRQCPASPRRGGCRLV